MLRHILERHLQLVEADLASESECVNRQRQIVAELLRSGEDATIAEARLHEAEETRAVYIAEVSRLARELASLPLGRERRR
jgi:hypothetical protein